MRGRKAIESIKSIFQLSTNEQLAEKISEYGKKVDPTRIAKWNTIGFRQSTHQLVLMLIDELDCKNDTIKYLTILNNAKKNT